MKNVIYDTFDVFGYSKDYRFFFDLFDYPIDIVVEIVSKWNVIEDVCSLDSAYCNKFRRTDFERLLKHTGFTQSGIEIEGFCDISYFFLEWIFLRSIKLYEIYLQIEDSDDFDLLCQLDLSKTTRLKLVQYSPNDGNLSILVNSCVMLKQLVLLCCQVSDSMILSVTCLHQLEYLKIFSRSSEFTMDSVSTLAANCKSLKKLCLIFSGTDGESSNLRNHEALLELLQRNLNLLSIDVDLINDQPLRNNTNISLLNDMVGYCKYLKKCELKWYGIFNISHLTTFLAYFNFIEYISLEVTDNSHEVLQVTSCYTYSHQNMSKCLKIVDHSIIKNYDFLSLFEQHEFNEIKLFRTQPVSNEIISQIAHRNAKSLQKLSLNDCGKKFTYDSIVKLLTCCKVIRSLYLNLCGHLKYVALVTFCPNTLLEKLHIVGTSHLVLFDLHELLNKCPRLVEFRIGDCKCFDFSSLYKFCLEYFPHPAFRIDCNSSQEELKCVKNNNL
jgi:hypothetical protein